MNRALKPWRPGITRRKAITIFAVSAALVAAGRGSANARLYEWTGIALGADARILLSTSDPEAARASIEAAIADRVMPDRACGCRRALRPFDPTALALLLRLVLERGAARHATSG